MVIINTQMRCLRPSWSRYARLASQPGPVRPGAVSKRMVASAAGDAASATRRISGPSTVPAVIAQALQLPVQHHAVFQPLVEGDGPRIPCTSPAWMLVATGPWVAWAPVNSDTGEPCSGRCPGPRLSHGWNGPPVLSRRSPSLVPPSTKYEHVHEDFVNDGL